MASAGEVLFSMEVVVEKLFILPQITCRFPNVAVKLLDFPAFSINYLDSEHVQRLRDKLSIDPHYAVGSQITELKHSDGSFHFERGKSCLCKICPDELRQHLSNTPMYLLVLDAFFKPPRLVGSCILPLAAAIDCIHDELLKEGVSVPATYGEKRMLRVSNLMGTDIGEMSVSYRLTSLGAVLLSHLPLDGTDAKSIENVDDETKAEILSSNLGAVDRVRVVADLTISNHPPPGLENADQQNGAAREAPVKTLLESSVRKASSSAVESPIVAGRSSHGTQTKTRQFSAPLEFDDYIIGSVYCPPPLYYCGPSGEEALSVPLRRVSELGWGVAPAAGSWSNESSGGGDDFDDDIRSSAVRVVGCPAGKTGAATTAAAADVAVGRSRVDLSEKSSYCLSSTRKLYCRHRRSSADVCPCRTESDCRWITLGHDRSAITAAAEGRNLSADAATTDAYQSGVSGSVSPGTSSQFPVLSSLLQELVGGLRNVPALVAESVAKVRGAVAASDGSIGDSAEAISSQHHLLPLLLQAAGRFVPDCDLAAVEPASSAANVAMATDTEADLLPPADPKTATPNVTEKLVRSPVLRPVASGRRNRDVGDAGSSDGGGGSSTLMWGSTRTQRLRLSQTNPEALKQLQSLERRRREKGSSINSRRNRSRSASAGTVTAAIPALPRQQQQRQPSATTNNGDALKKQATTTGASLKASKCTDSNWQHSISTVTSSVAAATAMLGAAAVAFAAATIARVPTAAPVATATANGAATTASPEAGAVDCSRRSLPKTAASRDGGGSIEGRFSAWRGRKSLEVRVPAASVPKQPPSPLLSRSDVSASDDGSADGGGEAAVAGGVSDGSGTRESSRRLAAAGSSTASSPALAKPPGDGWPDYEDENSDETEPDELKRYRLELQRMAATTTILPTNTAAAAAAATLLPPKVSSGSQDQQQQRQQQLSQERQLLKDPEIGVAGGSVGRFVVTDSYNRQEEDMSKITEQSEPEGSYSDDSFDSDISKSVSLPVTGDISDAESPHRLHGSDQYTDVLQPRASHASPILHSRPSNTVQSRSNPALQRSNSQQEGKPPLSSRSRGFAGSADSSRATASVRASDATGQSISRGDGGGQPTPDAGDSDGSYRALRARNEERRRRLKTLRDEMNTDSISSYDPSDRGPGSTSPTASEDWSLTSSAGGTNLKAALTLSRLAPANKFGYTT